MKASQQRLMTQRVVLSRHRGLVAVAGAVGAAFVLQLDSSIVNLALPAMAVDLDLGLPQLEWVVSSYMITFSSLLVLAGRVVDRFGLRASVAAGMGLFGVASFFAGIAPNGGALIAARIVQGIGAAIVAPATFVVCSTTFSDTRRRRKSVGSWGAAMSLATVLGPLAGGFLTSWASWRLVFIVNVPIGAVVLALVGVSLLRGPTVARERLGVVVNTVLTIAVACGVCGVIEVPASGWTNPTATGFLIAAAIGILAVIQNQRRASPVVINVGVFANRVVRLGTAALSAWSFAMFGIASYLSLYLQNVAMLGPAQAGIVFAPFAVAMAAASILSDSIATHAGTMTTVVAGFLLNAVGLGWIATFNAHQSIIYEVVPLVVLGVGAGLTMPLHAEIGSRLPAGRAAQASAMLSLSREISSLFGVVVLGAVITAFAGIGAVGGRGYLEGFQAAGIMAAIIVAAAGVLAAMSLTGGACSTGDTVENRETQ